MNDFTKEELEHLRVSNNIAIQYHGLSPVREELLEKLNLIIDNYCEHESNEYWHQLADCSYRFKRCSKCRREFDRHKWNNKTEEWDNDNQ